MVPLPVKVIPLLVAKVMSDVVLRVPLLSIMLSGSTEPGVYPRFAEFEIETVPPSIIVLPV